MSLKLIPKIVANVFVILFFGLLVAKLLDAKGASSRLEKRFGPFLRKMHIPGELVMAFFTAMFAGFAGEAFIASLVEERRLPEKMLVPGVMFIDFPNFFSFSPLILAITVPLVGMVGVYYLATQLFISLILTCTGAVLIYRMGEKNEYNSKKQNEQKRIDILKMLKDTLKVTLRVSLIVAVALCAVYALFYYGVIDRMLEVLASVGIPCLGSKALSISIAHAMHIAAGAAVAGKFLKAGLTPKAALAGMVWGYVLGTPIRGLRLVLPRYCSLFGLKNGVKTWLCVQLYRCFVAMCVALMLSLSLCSSI